MASSGDFSRQRRYEQEGSGGLSPVIGPFLYTPASLYGPPCWLRRRGTRAPILRIYPLPVESTRITQTLLGSTNGLNGESAAVLDGCWNL